MRAYSPGCEQPPCSPTTYRALERVGELLGRDVCWLYRRRFHFTLEREGWTVAISPESAGRFRLELCHWSRTVVCLWALADDDERLAAVVRELEETRGVRIGV